MDELTKHYNYKPYPYKHYESIFTRFYQGFILPEKFSVDKRRLHLSTLIVADQMDRVEALKDLEGLPYHDQQALDDDKNYFLKKMNWTKNQLNDYLERPSVEHDQYASERSLYENLSAIRNKLLPK